MNSSIKLNRIDKYTWEIPKGTINCMKVPTIVFADDVLLNRMKQDLTLTQATNTACLPGVIKAAYVMPDGHQGYGFPIGGVAATTADEGVIAPGGIGYDINCLHEDTEVLSDLGFRIRVKDLPKLAGKTLLKVFDVVEGHNDSSKVSMVAVRESDNYIYEIVLESGRVLKGSADHPVLTREGYKPMGEIRNGDLIAVYPFEGVPYELPKTTILLSEDDFAEEDEQIIQCLKERDLLPLRLSDPRTGVLARLIGYSFSDGSFNINEEKKGSARIIIRLYGDEQGLKEIRRDLWKYFSIKASKVYRRKMVSQISSPQVLKTVKGAEFSIKITSKAFSLLLEKLGAPLGKKADVSYDVPEWIKNAPLWIKRNFLAGLYGSERSKQAPLTVKHPCTTNIIALTFVRSKSLESNLKSFLNSLESMLSEFEIKSKIFKVKKYENRVMYRLVIYSNTQVLYKFLSRIGYEYTKFKEKALLFAEYLRRKLTTYSNIPQGITAVQRNKGIKKHMPAFEEFSRRCNAVGGLVFDEVVEVRKVRSDAKLLYDIGVHHRSHNFIANGIVVHNCGVRLMRTNLEEKDVRGKLRELVDNLFANVPSGVGSRGKLRLSFSELDEVLTNGAQWAVEKGFGWSSDVEHIESKGRIPGADPNEVSNRAKSRGAPQLGTLGAGNHFLEVQVIDKIYNPEIAKVFGLEHEGQVTVMIHTGSRGLGHQVASDYLMIMERAMKKYGIHPPERELASVPFNSKEGQDYFHAMCAAANFGFTNRQLITHWVREAFGRTFRTDPENLDLRLIYGLAHNIAKLEEHEIDGKRVKIIVHRKGATRAFPPGHPEIPPDHRSVGQVVLIPGSMGTASYVMAGVPEGAKTFYSSAHGAGRWMSRHKALRQYNAGMITSELSKKGIYVHAATKRVLVEEAPEAYKDVDRVALVTHKVKIATLVARLRPLGVVKG